MVLSIRTVRTVTLKDGVVAPLAKKASRTDCACWNGRNSPSLPGSVLPSIPGIKRQFAWVVSTLLVRLSRKRSEERRVGKECGQRGVAVGDKKRAEQTVCDVV